eukprot:s247_g39.t1
MDLTDAPSRARLLRQRGQLFAPCSASSIASESIVPFDIHQMRKPEACERNGQKLPAEQVSDAVVLAASFTMQRNAGATARSKPSFKTHSACVAEKIVQRHACSVKCKNPKTEGRSGVETALPFFHAMGASHTELGAFWIFKEADEWLGFSPTMTHALEEAYQTWISEEGGGAILPENMQYLAEFVKDDHPAQRICRLSRELQAPVKAVASVHLELKKFREQVRTLEAELADARLEIAKKHTEATVATAATGAELQPLLQTLRETLWLGRLVQWHPPDDNAASLLGRVVCVGATHGHVAVAFAEVEAVWLPAEALQPDHEAELMSRAGSKVYWQGDQTLEKAVVLSDSDPAMVLLQTESGYTTNAAIQDLTLRGDRRSERPSSPEMGDLLRDQNGWGMVVQSDHLGICIQPFDRSQASVQMSLKEVEEALAIGTLEVSSLQPGACVKHVASQQVGILYARHEDAATVDFLGELAWQGSVGCLAAAAEDSTLRLWAQICQLLPRHGLNAGTKSAAALLVLLTRQHAGRRW